MALDAKLELRLHSTSKADFIRRCEKLRVDSTDMHREIIHAFNSGRLRIKTFPGQSVIIKGIHDES